MHHDIDATPFVRRFLNGAFDILKFADIYRAQRRGSAGLLDCCNRRFAMTCRARRYHHFRAGCSKHARDTGADALTSARDDRNLVLEFSKH